MKYIIITLLLGLTQLHALTLTTSHTTRKQGDVLTCYVSHPLPLKSPTLKFRHRTLTLFNHPKPGKNYHYIAYIGIDKRTPLGTHPLIVTAKNTTQKATKKIKVRSGKFPSETITLPPKKAKMPSQTKQIRSEGSILGKQFRKKTAHKYFSGPFIHPAKGRFSSAFGTNRKYQGRITWQHSGLDIANKIGTPVLASHTGKVVLSKSLPIHGNTIMIDHGHGVISIYNHLHKRIAKVGQLVYQGKKIGTIGQTGISTGPHVHWGLSVQNVRVNPLNAFEN